MNRSVQHITTDLLIIGGGTAGCMAAIFAKRAAPSCSVIIAEKAHIKRSGCLAMGLNAVNAHLTSGTPEDYLAYVRHDNYDIVRDDLVLTMVHGEILGAVFGQPAQESASALLDRAFAAFR